MNGYELSRNWFDWSFENPELISPTHTAIYFFAIDQCNRLGWKDKFGLPSQMVMDAIGVKKHQTYTKHLQDLIDWGFIKLVQKSKNQYSANIISLKNAMPKNGKALGKALVDHAAKQSTGMGQSTGQSKDSIDKQETYTEQIQTNNIEDRKLKFAQTLEPYVSKYGREFLLEFYNYWTEPNQSGTKFRKEQEKFWDLSKRLATWEKNNLKFRANGSGSNFQKPQRKTSEEILMEGLQLIYQDEKDGKYNP